MITFEQSKVLDMVSIGHSMIVKLLSLISEHKIDARSELNGWYTDFVTHKLVNLPCLSDLSIIHTYLMPLSVILHSSSLLQKQCWSQEQGLASWGRRCMASASPGVSSIDIGHRQLTYSDSAWTVLMPPWSLMMNLSPIRQLATSRSNCKALKVGQYKKLWRLCERS